MARESFSFPESMMAEIIEVLRAGCAAKVNVSEDVEGLILDWCDDCDEYAQQWDRRRGN